MVSAYGIICFEVAGNTAVLALLDFNPRSTRETRDTGKEREEAEVHRRGKHRIAQGRDQRFRGARSVRPAKGRGDFPRSR